MLRVVSTARRNLWWSHFSSELGTRPFPWMQQKLNSKRQLLCLFPPAPTTPSSAEEALNLFFSETHSLVSSQPTGLSIPLLLHLTDSPVFTTFLSCISNVDRTLTIVTAAVTRVLYVCSATGIDLLLCLGWRLLFAWSSYTEPLFHGTILNEVQQLVKYKPI